MTLTSDLRQLWVYSTGITTKPKPQELTPPLWGAQPLPWLGLQPLLGPPDTPTFGGTWHPPVVTASVMIPLSKKSTRRGQNGDMHGNEKTRKPENQKTEKTETTRKPRNRENQKTEKTRKPQKTRNADNSNARLLGVFLFSRFLRFSRFS